MMSQQQSSRRTQKELFLGLEVENTQAPSPVDSTLLLLLQLLLASG